MLTHVILFPISDWACGGQWNRAYQFVRLLVDAFNAAHIELIAFFDGTLKENKKTHTDRVEIRQKTISVLKHIRMIGTPPPKIWWIPPSGLRTCLRNALRSMNVIVVSWFFLLIDQKVQEFCLKFHGSGMSLILRCEVSDSE